MNNESIVQKKLKIGLPHTNLNGIAEHLLFMFAGQFQWDIISEKINTPLSRLRTKNGFEIYATFFSVEVEFSEKYPISSFKLDDTLLFLYELSSYKNLIIDGKIIFGPADKIEETISSSSDPIVYESSDFRNFVRMRMSNIFITPRMGNDKLKISPPADASFSSFSPLDPRDKILSLNSSVEKNNKIDYFESPDWQCKFTANSNIYEYSIFPERDTNGAGLVYFANYIAFIGYAESALLNKISGSLLLDFSRLEISKRHIVYLGNVSNNDRLEIRIECFKNIVNENLVGFRYFVNRKSDGKLIAVSEAIKTFI